MKYLFLYLLLPLFSLGQTIHADKDKIIYAGSVSLSGEPATAVLPRLQTALQNAFEKCGASGEIQAAHEAVVSVGGMELTTPYHLIRTLHFTLQVTPKEGGYDYRIDSVSVSERRRGGKAKIKSSKELLEGIEDTGNVAIEAERLLNEADMRFQKLLAILETQIKGNNR